MRALYVLVVLLILVPARSHSESRFEILIREDFEVSLVGEDDYKYSALENFLKEKGFKSIKEFPSRQAMEMLKRTTRVCIIQPNGPVWNPHTPGHATIISCGKPRKKLPEVQNDDPQYMLKIKRLLGLGVE